MLPRSPQPPQSGRPPETGHEHYPEGRVVEYDNGIDMIYEDPGMPVAIGKIVSDHFRQPTEAHTGAVVIMTMGKNPRTQEMESRPLVFGLGSDGYYVADPTKGERGERRKITANQAELMGDIRINREWDDSPFGPTQYPVVFVAQSRNNWAYGNNDTLRIHGQSMTAYWLQQTA
jgi:hypothetical protein